MESICSSIFCYVSINNNFICTITMSKISRLVSALAGDAYKEAKAIYDDILSTGTEREKQDAKYIMKVM